MYYFGTGCGTQLMKPYLYQKLTKSLLFELIGHRYKSGDRFLSKRKVMKLWRVSEPTAKSALGYLVEHGLIEARPRSGYRVSVDFRPKALILLHFMDSDKLKPPGDWLARVRKLIAETPTSGFRLGVVFDSPDLRTLNIPDHIDMNHPSVVLQCMQAFFRAAREHGCSVEWFFRDGSANTDRKIVDAISQKRLHGCALFRKELSDPASIILDFLLNSGITALSLFDDAGQTEIPGVKFNNFGIGYDAASRLIQNGHRKMVVVAPLAGRSPFDERVDGFQFAVKELSDQSVPLECQVETCRVSNSIHVAKALYPVFKNPKKRPTALFFCGYHLAAGVQSLLDDFGLKVPRDISVAACGRTETVDRSRPKSDIYDMDIRELGKLGFDQLHRMLRGEPTEHILTVDIEYISRGALASPLPSPVSAASQRSAGHRKQSRQ